MVRGSTLAVGVVSTPSEKVNDLYPGIGVAGGVRLIDATASITGTTNTAQCEATNQQMILPDREGRTWAILRVIMIEVPERDIEGNTTEVPGLILIYHMCATMCI